MRRTFALVVALMLSLSGSVCADIGAKDFQIIARTLSLLSSKPSGRITIAVVYSPTVPASQQEADQIRAVLDQGLNVGNMTLVATLVPVDRLDGLDGATAAYVTQGLSAFHDTIFNATKVRHLPSLTRDFACVRAAKCVMALETQPQVQIVLSKVAAEASRVSFASAFRLLVSEI